MARTNFRPTPLALLGLAMACSVTGCVGGIRDSTTPRTATEMLLVSQAASDAIHGYDASALSGKRVWIDESHFESVDKAYVVSALRHHLSKSGAVLTAAADADSELVVEIRNASLGIEDSDFTLGIPGLPIESLQGLAPVTLPPLYLVRRTSQQSWAKLQLWVFEPSSQKFTSKSGNLWGYAYYNQWFFFGLGPFDWSNDVYPDDIETLVD
jgi:Family of unknown function (DUF6655)